MHARNSLFGVAALSLLAALSGCGAGQATPQANSLHAPPAKPACTEKQAEAAWGATERLQDWAAVKKFYDDYRACDEGGIAEGSSEAVSRLLADHWDMLGTLAGLTDKDAPFRTFVLNHINSTLATRDLETIAEHTRTACPANARSLCQAITTQATHALRKQMEEDGGN